MSENKRVSGSDLAKVDAHVIQPAEYEEAPEWTDDMFDRADFYHGEKLIRRGRPPKAEKKVSIHLRVAPDIAKAFRATGKGWQTRAQQALREWVEKHAVS